MPDIITPTEHGLVAGDSGVPNTKLCPKCMTMSCTIRLNDHAVHFGCGSWMGIADDSFHESTRCILRQRDNLARQALKLVTDNQALKARVKYLEMAWVDWHNTVKSALRCPMNCATCYHEYCAAKEFPLEGEASAQSVATDEPQGGHNVEP